MQPRSPPWRAPISDRKLFHVKQCRESEQRKLQKIENRYRPNVPRGTLFLGRGEPIHIVGTGSANRTIGNVQRETSTAFIELTFHCST